MACFLLATPVRAKTPRVAAGSATGSCLAGLPQGLTPAGGPFYDAHLWRWLESRHDRIGRIEVRIVNVFNRSRAGQDTWYARVADFIHAKTEPSVIRDALLFKSGQTVVARTIYETERNLRALPFVRAVRIEPESCLHHVVEVAVIEKDAWTLKLDYQFTHVGGASEIRYKALDTDIFGTGKTLSVSWQKTLQRTETDYVYEDPALFGSRWTGFLSDGTFSDGYQREITLARPFYRDQDPWSLAVSGLSQKENLDLYLDGVLVESVPNLLNTASVTYGHLISFSGDTGERFYLGWSRHTTTYETPIAEEPGPLLPLDLFSRRMVGPTLGWQLFQDRYRSFENIRLIDRVEDYNLGWNVMGTLGIDPSWLGSLGDSLTFDLDMSVGSRLFGHDLLLASGVWQVRRQSGQWQNESGQLGATYYNQDLPEETWVLHTAYAFTVRPDPLSLLYIGGIQGLRGYPNYFRLGTRMWTATLEDRVVTPITLFHSFVLGFVAYTDCAQIEELAPVHWSRIYQDVGGGLRIGNLRSAYGQVYYLTMAFPLVHAPGVPAAQFIVGDIVHF
ncbi:hypothetical protein B1B_01671 [mine drainage metagenome]|uniref:Uncharacterized protein n=3 Tax=mine drainage metagenome TaxID=410659 RepID=T1D4M0_9ZZZZ